MKKILIMDTRKKLAMMTENLPHILILDDPFSISKLDHVAKDLTTSKNYTRLCPTLINVFHVSSLS